MIKGVFILHKNGLLITSFGFEKSELLSALISATIGIAEEVGAGKLRTLEYEGMILHITNLPNNKNILVIIASDEGDFSAPFIVKRLAYILDPILRDVQDVIPDEVIAKTQKALIQFFRRRELPSFKSIVNFANLIYSGIPQEKAREIEKTYKEIVEKETRDERKLLIKIGKPRPAWNIEKVVRELTEAFFNLKLYDAFNKARILESSKKYHDIGKLLSAKIASILLQLPPPFKSPQRKDVEDLLEGELHTEEELIEFTRLQVYAITRGWRDKLRRFMLENSTRLIEILNNPPENLENLYSILFFIQSRTIFRTPLGDEVIANLADKSDILYKLMLNERNITKLYNMILIPTRWIDLKSELQEYRLNYLKIKGKKLPSGEVDWLSPKYLGLLIDYIVALREYLISAVVAFESYGLHAMERKKILQEVYETAIEDALNLMALKPPMTSRVYYDLYQSILYILYYLKFLETHSKKTWLWRDIKEISREGFDFFLSYYVRGRMSPFQFVVYTAPIAYFLAKGSLRLLEIPEELLMYLYILSNIDEETIQYLDEQVPEERVLILIQLLFVLFTLTKKVINLSLRNTLQMTLLRIMDVVGDWALFNAEISKEFIDDFGDMIINFIDTTDNVDFARDMIYRITIYANVLVEDVNENPFEAALFFEKVFKTSIAFLEKFGQDEVVLDIAKQAKNIAKNSWKIEGFSAKAKELENIFEEYELIDMQSLLTI